MAGHTSSVSGITGGLFNILDLLGLAFFTILIGSSRASRDELRPSRVIVGGLLSFTIAGVVIGLFVDASSWGTYAVVGAIVGFLLAIVLLNYVSNVEDAENRERIRAERIAQGLPADPPGCMLLLVLTALVFIASAALFH